uniref:Complement component 5 n=1 Tax=Denticeps clupeoides TaxID=299321 RepID=A0AAY4ESR9_9TELE
FGFLFFRGLCFMNCLFLLARYLITGPRFLRLDAAETLVVQLFGYQQDSTVNLYLKKSLVSGDTVYAQESVQLTQQNHYQASVTLRIFSKDFPKEESKVILHAVSGDFSTHSTIPVSRDNGFLFVQTDKPLYTPEQSGKAARSGPLLCLFFIFYCLLGVWRIEAAYTDDFSTIASTEFEVKEYVLPSISVHIQPEENYISDTNFEAFKLKISARYVHGAPVTQADVYLRLGYISGTSSVLIQNTLRKHEMTDGAMEVVLNIKQALLSAGEGPKELRDMQGNNLHVVVLIQEKTGGISQEAELATIKFVLSPFTLSLIATPPFIKPALPYTIRVLVKDPLGEPVRSVPVKATAATTNVDGVQDHLSHPDQTTQRDGIAYFTYNIPRSTYKADFSFVTADRRLSAQSQATFKFSTETYNSPNKRYLYIDLPSQQSALQVNDHVSIKVYFSFQDFLPLKSFSYQIISKGKVVKFDTQQRVGDRSTEIINIHITPDMVPSARLLVYYILSGEERAELVADSVWIDVKDKCVNGLKLDLSSGSSEFNPQDELALMVKTKQNALVALSSVDTALYSLRVKNNNPLSRVLQHIEASDQGCGGGGGKDNADVLQRAGLTFLTNANAMPSNTADTCSASVRPKRSVPQELYEQKAKTFGAFYTCCLEGLYTVPKLETCLVRADRLRKDKKVPHKCVNIFEHCCHHGNKLRQEHKNTFSLSRALFALKPMQIRSYFPESWMWEEHLVLDGSGHLSISRRLPDSLTTWEIKAVGMFTDGICVSDPLRVRVTQKVSVDVPVPYALVRGEQLELRGSVYNQEEDGLRYKVTLKASEGLCVFQGTSPGDGSSKVSPNNMGILDKDSVGTVRFFIMALEAGTHTLNFTLQANNFREKLVKTLRVIPEGIRTMVLTGATIDPKGIYGNPKRKVELRNSLPPKVVPKSTVQRLLTVNGELFGEILSIINNPEGLLQLTNLPRGSAEVELVALLPFYYVFQYLETSEKWSVMGPEAATIKEDLRRKMQEGHVSIMSFKNKREYSFSMWKNREASTWLTALVVKTLAEIDKYIPVDRTALTNTINWLTVKCQRSDGSFEESSSYKPVKLMGAGADVTESSVYLTSFVVIGIKNAMNVPGCGLQMFADALNKAESYIAQNVDKLKSMYVRAIAAYALTLMDRNSIPATRLYEELQKEAKVKGNPAVIRFWEEKNADEDPLKPNKASAQTVETTVYVLLTVLLRGDGRYAKPVLAWLTQDQRYGGGFLSTQDTVLTLEALTKYNILVKHANLDMDVHVTYRNNKILENFIFLQVTQNYDVILSTGLSSGVAFANLKTVYYKMTEDDGNCHFDISIDILSRNPYSNDYMELSPRIFACVKYKPLENEVFTEASHTVLEIHLPTGVKPFQEDLAMMQDGLESLISNYEIKDDRVLLQLDSVPSDESYCVAFRIQELFQTGMAVASWFQVYEYRNPESRCSKLYYPQERKLLRLCAGDQCQCMAAECCNFRSTMDSRITAEMRRQDICQESVKYAFKVQVVSAEMEGDFVTYKAKVKDVFKTGKGTEDIKIETDIELVKKATCSSTNIVEGKQYLMRGTEIMQERKHRSYSYKFPLDSQAQVDLWPEKTACSGSCSNYLDILEEFSETMLLEGC